MKKLLKKAIKKIGAFLLKCCKVIVFLAIALVLFLKISNVLVYEDDTHTKAVYNCFYSMEEDSIDAVWIGASCVQTGIISSEAYTHNGIALYSMANASFPFAMTQYVIEEVEKTQSPEIYLVDIRMLAYKNNFYQAVVSEENIRRETDNMRYSKNRIQAIDTMTALLQKMTYNKVDLDNYYFPFTNYHERWKNLNDEDWGKEDESYLGFYYYKKTKAFDPDQEKMKWSETDEEAKLTNDNKACLDDFLDYLDQHPDIHVVFTNMPNCLELKEKTILRQIEKRIKKRGYDVLDLDAKADEIGINYWTDFAEGLHMNYKGAFKVTDYAADYLKKEYHLKSHRNDDNYQVYEDAEGRLLTDLRKKKLDLPSTESSKYDTE